MGECLPRVSALGSVPSTQERGVGGMHVGVGELFPVGLGGMEESVQSQAHSLLAHYMLGRAPCYRWNHVISPKRTLECGQPVVLFVCWALGVALAL